MNGLPGKTLYVLGAGASFHTGAPLLKDFLANARFILGSGKGTRLRYKDDFEHVFKWIEGLRSASYYVEFDLDNLEHVFSLAEMRTNIGMPDGPDLRTSLRRLIVETLDQSMSLAYVNGRFNPDDLYARFVQTLKNLNDERQKLADIAIGIFQKDTLITFNYDVSLDYALGGEPEYALTTQKKGIRLRF